MSATSEPRIPAPRKPVVSLERVREYLKLGVLRDYLESRGIEVRE